TLRAGPRAVVDTGLLPRSAVPYVHKPASALDASIRRPDSVPARPGDTRWLARPGRRPVLFARPAPTTRNRDGAGGLVVSAPSLRRDRPVNNPLHTGPALCQIHQAGGDTGLFSFCPARGPATAWHVSQKDLHRSLCWQARDKARPDPETHRQRIFRAPDRVRGHGVINRGSCQRSLPPALSRMRSRGSPVSAPGAADAGLLKGVS